MITEVVNAIELSIGSKVITIQKSGYYVMSITYTPTGPSPEFSIDALDIVLDTFLTSSNTVHLYRAVLGYIESGRQINFGAINCVVRIMIERVG